MGASLPGEGRARIPRDVGARSMDWKTYYRNELRDPSWKARLDEWLEQGPDPRIVDAFALDGVPSAPHTAVGYSGRWIARLVSSLYESGVRRVLALGVLHTSMLPQAAVARDPNRSLVERREATNALSGVILPGESEIDTAHGPLPAWRPAEEPGLAQVDRRGILTQEFSLDTLASVLALSARSTGRAPLPLLRAYVGLTRDPIDGAFSVADRVADWVRHHWTPGTAVVTTGDLVHFGTAYGMAEDDPRKASGVDALTPAFRAAVAEALKLGLAGDDEEAYVHSSDRLHSDQREILPVLSRLLGRRATGEILEFSLSDYAEILTSASPCLVASALVVFRPGSAAIE